MGAHSLVEAMAKAMSGLNPNMLEPGGYTETYWREQAQAALDCVLKRLREPDEALSDAIWMVQHDGCATTPAVILAALATHLDQERSRE
jgi:hypothetical protein